MTAKPKEPDNKLFAWMQKAGIILACLTPLCGLFAFGWKWEGERKQAAIDKGVADATTQIEIANMRTDMRSLDSCVRLVNSTVIVHGNDLAEIKEDLRLLLKKR